MHLGKNLGSCEFARTTITKYHKSGCLNNRNLSHNPGGLMFGIKVSTGLVPSEGYRGESVPCLSLALGSLLATFGTP